MKLKTLILWLFSLALLVGAAAVPVTSKPYQDLANALPRSDGILRAMVPQGGVIELPAGDIVLDKPLLIGSGVEVVGKGWGATRLYYDGPGAAVRFMAYAGSYHHGGTVRDLAIYSKIGDGVAIVDGCRAESATVKNVVINAGRDAITFRGPDRYMISVENVFVAHAGRFALDADVVRLKVDGLNFCNPGRPLPEAKVGRPIAMVNVEGSGSIENSRLEGPWQTSLLRTRGDFSINDNHIEPTAFGGPQIIVEGYATGQAHPRSVTIDRPRFVQPRAPIELRGQVVLHVTTDDPGNETSDGGRYHDNPETPTIDESLWNIAECYRVGPMAKLYVNGEQILPPPQTK